MHVFTCPNPDCDLVVTLEEAADDVFCGACGTHGPTDVVKVKK